MAPFDLTLMILQRDGLLDASFCYDTSLIQARRSRNWRTHFAHCSRFLWATPMRPVAQLGFGRHNEASAKNKKWSLAVRSCRDSKQNIGGPERIALVYESGIFPTES